MPDRDCVAVWAAALYWLCALRGGCGAVLLPPDTRTERISSGRPY